MALKNRSAQAKPLSFREKTISIAKEVCGGVTAWTAAAYIIFVNPAILSQGGQTDVYFEAVFMATCISMGIMNLIMGMASKGPFVLAAGIGINTALISSAAWKMGLDYRQAMGIIVIGGLLGVVLVLAGGARIIMEAVPLDLKYAMQAGVGLWLIFTGALQAGFIELGARGMIRWGDFTASSTLLAVFGVISTSILLLVGIKAAVMAGVAGTAIAGIALRIISVPETIISIPGKESFSTFLKADLPGAVWNGGTLNASVLALILSFATIGLFDSLGVVAAVGSSAKLLDSRGNLPGLKKIMAVDRLSAAVGGVLGSGSINVRPESAAGILGTRQTGLIPVTAGALFLLSVFFAPLTAVLGGGVEAGGIYRYPVTSPVLIVVGCMMIRVVRRIDFRNPEISIPALLMMAVMPLTGNISYGLGTGFIVYTILMLCRKKYRQIRPAMAAASLLFIAVFILEALTRSS